MDSSRHCVQEAIWLGQRHHSDEVEQPSDVRFCIIHKLTSGEPAEHDFFEGA